MIFFIHVNLSQVYKSSEFLCFYMYIYIVLQKIPSLNDMKIVNTVKHAYNEFLGT